MSMHINELLNQYEFTEWKSFDIDSIKLDRVVRDLCKKNTCGHYGRNYMCPPAVKPLEEWEKEIFSFDNAVIVTRVYPTEGGYDIKAWLEAAADFQKRLIRLKGDIVDRHPQQKMLMLGAGACLTCPKCACIDDEPCRFPDQAVTSLEACGIDVMGLSKRVGVKYNNGKNSVTYIGAILY